MSEQASFGFADEGPEPEATTYTVVELNSLVRDTLRRAHPTEVWVRGEVQNLNRSSAGHTYFTLVEKAGRGDRVQGKLEVALLCVDRARIQMLAYAHRSELLSWSPPRPHADELLMAPPNLRVPDPSFVDELKSGNFGASDFFVRAFSVLDEAMTK